MTNLIELKNVNKQYKEDGSIIHIFKNLSLIIKRGEHLVLWGRSGSGKTTFLQLISGMINADKGKILLDKTDLKEKLQKSNNLISWVFQDSFLIPHLTVKENIMLLASVYKTKNQLNQFVVEYSSKLEIEHLLDKYPDNLSGGEKQRIALLRALCVEPQILIIDEPTSSLDDQNKQKIIDILNSKTLFRNSTIIITTHDMRLSKLPFKHKIINDFNIINKN